MKITKEEILEIAKLINVDLNNEEIKQVEESISQIVTRFDEMLGVEELTKPMVSPTPNINQFSSNENEADGSDVFEHLNNHDGTYIKTKKVIGDE